MKSLPLFFKEYLSYQEIGILSMSTFPYSIKFLWAPLSELYYSKSFGKRKSWIIPT